MYLLDTNIISEIMSAKPAKAVADWLAERSPDLLFTCAVCEAEIRYGIERMPDGKRRDQLMQAARLFFASLPEERVLPYDSNAAAHYARIRVKREQLGRRVEVGDLMIAAIARAHRFMLVTRNARDFDDLDLTLINPWEAP